MGYMSINTLQTFKAADRLAGPLIRLGVNDTRSDLLLAFGVHGASGVRYTIGLSGLSGCRYKLRKGGRYVVAFNM